MMCYRDMTFCPYWRECQKGEKCKRALTPDVEFEAGRLPIRIAKYLDTPTCFSGKASKP